MLAYFLGAKKSGKKKGKGSSGGRGGGKANVGCGTGAGGFAKGNTCRRGGAGTGEKPGGPVSKKAREDAAKEQWTQYKPDKNGKFPDRKNLQTESKSGLPAKINVEKGPPRNKREEKALERAQKAGKEAIVRTSVKSAYTAKTEKTKEFWHGEERIATVMLTKDIPSIKPTMNGKPYDPADYTSVKGSKYTVVAESSGGAQVSGHNRRGYADKVARSHVKAERDEWAKEAEFKMVKNHQKDNLVKETLLGREPKSVLTIRVLTPKGSQVEDLAMKKNGFNEELCDRRRRIAALRDNVDAPPVKLARKVSDLYKGVWSTENLVTAVGDPVGSDKENFALLQEFLADKGVQKPLTKNDVYIHWLEAANGNFIPDRFMFLDSSTLRNVAARASDGFAFMNSHRTGGLSAPAELPYGRTFAGRYEEAEKDGILHRRALVGVYMLKGVRPNGDQGMSTDDLHESILGGTISDVSMGLVGGTRQCDVCVSELGSKDCPHVPATHNGLSPQQKEAQQARGVSGGKASYTLIDAVPQEVSAVYKGAVPGAGFRKAMLYSRSPSFRSQYGQEVLSSYGALLGGREKLQFSGKPSKDAKMPRFNIIDFLKSYRDAGSPDPDEIDLGDIDGSNLGTIVPKPTAESHQTKLAEERAQFLREKEAFEAERAQYRLVAFKVEAETKFAPFVADSRLSVHQKDALVQLYVFAASDDATSPVKGADGKEVKRTDLLFKGLEELKTRGSLVTEEIGEEPTVNDGETVLANGPDKDTDVTKPSENPSKSRIEHLASLTEPGKAGLESKRAK